MRTLVILLVGFIVLQLLFTQTLVYSTNAQDNTFLSSSSLSRFIIYQASATDPCSTVMKTINVTDYGLSPQGHFRLLSDSSLILNSTFINKIKDMAEMAYSALVNFFNATPYDQDHSGIIDILIANLNEKYGSGVFIAGYTIPGSDPNGMSIEYLDANYLLTSSYLDVYTTIAHEMFHLIQASIFNLSQHADWVVEGTAVFASDYAIKGYSPLQDSIYLATDHFNESLNTPEACLSLDVYIADYVIAPTFFEFLAEQYGLSIIPKFIHKLAHENDTQALQDVTNSTMGELFSRFAVWNYLGLYKGTNYTFENVSVSASPMVTLNLGSSYEHTILPFSINYIELVPTSSLIYISHEGKLNFALIKLKSNLGKILAYEVSYISNETMIYVSNSSDYNRIILAIVNVGNDKFNYTISYMPSNISVITLTTTKTIASNAQASYLYVIILLFAVAFIVTLALFLHARQSVNKASSQET
ncbi:MAG TPA: hypothetical protein VKU94_07020 [Geobacterales bacterium]|nr:hypothetical protein [Geobacterales bacterium]